jgi:hypothetical protein
MAGIATSITLAVDARHAGRRQSIPYVVVAVALRGTSSLRYLCQLIDQIVPVIRCDPIEVISLARAVTGVIVGVAGFAQRTDAKRSADARISYNLHPLSFELPGRS